MQKTRNPLIFVVQDSVVYKDLIVGYLKSRKYQNIKTFNNGEECLKAAELKPDLIVLDYSFDGLNGLEIMRKVKQEQPETEFIFLSSQIDVEVAVKLMKAGAADYIVKNEKAPNNLAKAIDHLIAESRQEKVKKGYKIGVIGFFMVLFLIIMIIILMTIFFEDFTL